MQSCLSLLLLLMFGRGNSPAWAPPANPVPHAILEEARDDKRQGRFETALAKFVWYHENALAIEPSQEGVRLSFALSGWLELARQYPPALDRMTKSRNAAAKDVASGKDVLRAFRDLAALDRTLGDETRTRSAFEMLDRKDPEAARNVFEAALPALIRGKSYALANEYVDPATDFARMSERYRDLKQMAAGSDIEAEDLEFANRFFANRTATLVAILAINDRQADAEKVALLAQAEWNDAAFHATLGQALQGVVPEPWP